VNFMIASAIIPTHSSLNCLKDVDYNSQTQLDELIHDVSRYRLVLYLTCLIVDGRSLFELYAHLIDSLVYKRNVK
jgi:hypothetical protein